MHRPVQESFHVEFTKHNPKLGRKTKRVAWNIQRLHQSHSAIVLEMPGYKQDKGFAKAKAIDGIMDHMMNRIMRYANKDTEAWQVTVRPCQGDNFDRLYEDEPTNVSLSNAKEMVRAYDVTVGSPYPLNESDDFEPVETIMMALQTKLDKICAEAFIEPDPAPAVTAEVEPLNENWGAFG